MKADSFCKHFTKQKKTRTEHVLSIESLTDASDEPGSAQTVTDHIYRQMSKFLSSLIIPQKEIMRLIAF